MSTKKIQQIKGKRVLVTGGAGFLGSNFVEKIIKNAEKVIVYDNLSSGRYEFIKKFNGLKNFRFVKGDTIQSKLLHSVIKKEKPEIIVHFAANQKIQIGTKNTFLDIKQGPIATHNLLEAARKNDVESIIYSSSGTVYGKAKIQPTTENYGPLVPISFYAASKIACEGLITTYNSLHGINYYIYRFGNIVGKNQTHGIIFDLIKKLRKNDKILEVLGNGKQKKTYIDVIDCVRAIIFVYEKERNITLNIGTIGQTEVEMIAKEVIAKVAPEAKIDYTGTKQGWPGDVEDTYLDNRKMLDIGVKLKYMNSDQAVLNAIDILSKKV